MTDTVLIIIAAVCGTLFGMLLMALFIANDDRPIRCPECRYYYAPVCTFHKWLPMTSRRGYCHHARKGKYEGEVPTIEKAKDS